MVRGLLLSSLLGIPLTVVLLTVMIRYATATPHDVAAVARKQLTTVAAPYRRLHSYPNSLQVVGGLTGRGIGAAIANKQAMRGYQQPETGPSLVFVSSTRQRLQLSVKSYGYLVTLRLQPGQPSKLLGVPARIATHERLYQVATVILYAVLLLLMLVSAEVRFQFARRSPLPA